MTPVLSARGLQRTFGAVVAAADINVDVAQGERLCLIGSNGAGKTTFVNMVTGYLKPTEGSILLAGEDVTRRSPREITRRGVARSFQIPQLCLHMTVLENMLTALHCTQAHAHFLRPARDAASLARCDQLLAAFGVAEHAQRLARELPGGVRKLLDIAMALTGQPRLLLLDEPTSGVSADEKFAVMDTVVRAIEGRQDEAPVTVVFVEHDMDIVRRYASRVAAFSSGRIIADGAPAHVLADADVQRYVTGSLPASLAEAA
ncbi:ABC transporter ATP-binding protein [Ramlibacter sp. USB13]|uniref:ABC transporter ATP-binding protein n=1 Tax=Ramlibacter cellulosilyticus TaxID=2764187 RepID=A0A923MVS5_9BURK|nr:ABC transporter ATP-binding protein [Ramlibacter cellulosilyticus]MBC5786060.1 ABC transporter ATP-binding protein [Ramlibacter cellulosilyticus]